MPIEPPALPPEITVFERGWLSANNVLFHGHGATVLVDSGYCAHAAQTVALVESGLQGRPLDRLLNTHLHSDHCGGNAALQARWPRLITHIPPGQWDQVQAWDPVALSYEPTGQDCPRFRADGRLMPGSELTLGGSAWQVHAAPGHDPHAVLLFEPRARVLISGDALWENGFGVVFPELVGEPGFDEVGATLELIATLGARWVVPGHGTPFNDVPGALQRARALLDRLRADPLRHRRHAAKVLLKYHLMEERAQSLPRLQLWVGDTPYLRRLWHDLGRPTGSLHGWCEALVHELAAGGALHLRDGVVHDGPPR